MKELLKQRNLAKKKKPNFIRTDSNKYKFNKKWAKPRGLHNKLRLRKKGHQKSPRVGYGSPKLVKGLNREGKKEVLIFNIKDLEKIGKNCIAKLSAGLGLKKKILLVEECIKRKIKIVNLKDASKFLIDVKEKISKRKKESKQKLDKKKKKKEELLKKAKEKEEKKDQEDVKKEVLDSKVEQKGAVKDIVTKQDTTRQKAGHIAGSVPGTRQ